MKAALFICATAITFAAHTNLFAEELNTDLTLKSDSPPASYYHSRELSLDAFGGVAVGQATVNSDTGARTHHDLRAGTGTGVNYFFNRNVGIAAEGFTENPRHSFVDNADGSMVFRLPLGGSRMAAYIFGGAGHQFDPNATTTFHTGGGLEYRFTQHFGAFLEPRIVFKQGNYGFGRCDVRWNF